MLAQPHRRYLTEGFLIDTKEKKKIFYFLFNDLMIGSKMKKRAQKSTTKEAQHHSYKYLHRIRLADASIAFLPNASIKHCYSFSFISFLSFSLFHSFTSSLSLINHINPNLQNFYGRVFSVHVHRLNSRGDQDLV